MPASLLPVTGTLHPTAVVTRRVRVRDRLAARLQPFSLDAELARGVSPDASVRLVLRGHRLISPAVRQSVARSPQRAIRDAHAGRRRMSAVALRRGAVIDAAPRIETLARRLAAPGPVGVAGVAAARMLIVEARSPLYAARAPDTLEVAVERALAALEPAGVS